MKLVTIDTGPHGMPGAWLPSGDILHTSRAAEPGRQRRGSPPRCATAPWEARMTWELNIMGKQFPGFTATGPS